MEKNEAMEIQRQRNRARKQVSKYKKLLWSTPIGSANFAEYQSRYEAAVNDLENVSLTYKQALKHFLCAD